MVMIHWCLALFLGGQPYGGISLPSLVSSISHLDVLSCGIDPLLCTGIAIDIRQCAPQGEVIWLECLGAVTGEFSLLIDGGSGGNNDSAS